MGVMAQSSHWGQRWLNISIDYGLNMLLGDVVWLFHAI